MFKLEIKGRIEESLIAGDIVLFNYNSSSEPRVYKAYDFDGGLVFVNLKTNHVWKSNGIEPVNGVLTLESLIEHFGNTDIKIVKNQNYDINVSIKL